MNMNVDDEITGLEGLGVSVQSQQQLESDIIEQISEEIKKKEQENVVKQVRKELRAISDGIKNVARRKKECEKQIKHIYSSQSEQTSQQSRKISSLLNDQESFENNLKELFSSQKNSLQRLKDCDYNYDNDPSVKNLVITNRSLEQEDENEAEESAETELQKSIRLGDVTAFGNSLHTTSSSTSSSERRKQNFDNYLSQLCSQKPSACSARKRSASPDSESEFVEVSPDEPSSSGQHSRVKVRKLSRRTLLARDQPEPDDDWKPDSEEELEENSEPLIKKKPEKASSKPQRRLYSEDETGWQTDDSDWEGTDDEDPEMPRRRRRKVGDDGDLDLYKARLESWRAGRSEEEAGLEGEYEELEGGLQVPGVIWSRLYNYQKVGVQWMFELHQQKCGGILGDEMGLGKTIQVITFLSALSFSQKVWSGSAYRGLGPSLIVCPTTLLHQWVSEFHHWWPPLRVAVLHSSGSHSGSKAQLVRNINSSGGVLVLSYQAVTSLIDIIANLSWHYVILDEGHKIRNPDAKVTLAVKQVASPHRLILSGSPLQNNLKELWSLFDFIYPGKLGTLPVFLQQFSGPITVGGYANASTVQVATAYKCATVLRDTISPYLLRRLKEDVKNHINLPEKNEQVLFCRLSDEQRALYRSYIEGSETKSILSGQLKVFVGLIALRKICNHPDLFSGAPKLTDLEKEEVEDVGGEYQFGYYKRSGKMIVVHSLLKLWRKQGQRVLLFSQSQQMLTIIESYVREKGYKYLRLDGRTPIGSRQKLIKEFNEGDHFVFILTTKVGGLGVNLTGANRVVIFDPDWNPSTDTQARERSWRIGQNKQVTIYRLMTAGTIEEKIYHRQIFKQFLVNKILKDPKQRRFFKSNDLYELFTLSEATEEDNTETSAIFAGTGANIKVRPQSRVSKPQATQVRSEAVGAATDVKLSLSRLYAEAELAEKNTEKEEEDVITEDVRQRLREQARRISAKFSKKKSNDDQPGGDPPSTSKYNIPKMGLSQTDQPQDCDRPRHSLVADKAKRKHKKHKKHKVKKFEGVKVPHLVKQRRYKAPQQNERDRQGEERQEKGEEENSQNNYVLAKLFAKSGVHSALQHDAIVEGDQADYAIVESEATEVARRAVRAMKSSRRDCLPAESGTPNWTGSNGGIKKKKFGPKKKKPPGPSMSSTELLSIMKNRNRLVSHLQPDQDHEADLFRPDDQQEDNGGRQEETVHQGDMDLLTDIRNFVAFQAEADGEASTAELVNKFKSSLPSQKSPLFKAFLQQICDFNRNHEGKGIWKLKTEFR